MRRAIVTLLVLLSFGLKAQVYQAMPQAGYGPVKRMLFDSVLTIPLNINQLRNITGGRDAGQIRYNVSDSGLYVFTGYTWIKANLDSVNLSNRINGKLNITDTAYMLSWYMRKTDTLSLSNRINLRVKYTDTAAMLDPYLRKLDTASLSRRIDEKQNIIKLTTNFKSGAATLIRDTLNIPKYSDTLSDAYVPYVGANKDVDLGAYGLRANKLKSDFLLEIQNQQNIQNETLDYTSIGATRTGFSFYTGWMQGQNTFTQSNIFNYANTNLQNNSRQYNLPVRNGTLALVEDTVNLSNRINLKADKATVLTINGVGYDLSANRTWTIPTFDSTSISNRINLKLNISDTALMLSPYLRKADTSSLSNRIDLRVKYSDTAAMLSPYLKSAVTSVGLTMPAAFNVSNSPITTTGTLAVTGAGTASQYIRGDGQLATLPPSNTGSGSSVNYYLNGGVSQGTIGGSTYYQMSKNAVIGTTATFTRLNSSGDGLIAEFITDVADPNRLEIPSGAWNFELFFNASSSGGSPAYYVELLKYNGSTFTSIASNSATTEIITGGTATDLYLSSLAVPYTALSVTDRLVVRVYVITSGKNITLHTQNGNLCQIVTTFPSGMASLNGLTANTQYLATDTLGSDFNISSVTDTHKFNLPTSSASKRGALSSTDWSTFNGKMNFSDTVSLSNRINTKLNSTDTASLSNRINTKLNSSDTASLSNRINAKADALSGTTNTVPKFTSSTTIGNSNIKDNGNAVSVNTTAGSFGALQVGSYNGNILMNTTNTNGGLIFQNTSSSNKLWDFSSDNNDLVFNESNVNPVMKLKAGGNVVISNLSGTGTRMVVADANGVLSSQAISSDTTSLSNRINLKLNISDTASMLSPYLRKVDTASLSNRINTKQGTITLTTTGTSGAATFTSNTLNIPQYQAAGTYVTSVTGTSPIVSSGGTTPAISIPAATSSVNGYLSSTDWTTFNNKSNTNGTVTSVAALTLGTSGTDLSSTVTNSTTTPVITLNVPTASASNRGALSSADWTTFNNKVSNATLSGYLPLTGGTLTGALGGTSASFSSSITSTLSSGIFLNNGSGGTNASQIRINNTSGDARFGIESSTGATIQTETLPYAVVLGNQANNPLQFTTNGTARMTVSSGGNVGIGTVNPSMPLTVQANSGNGAIRLIGTSNSSSSNAGIYWYDSNDATFNGYIGNFSASFDFYNQRSTPMSFYTSGSERLKISSGGSINFSGTDATTQYYFGYNRPTATNLLVNGGNNNKIRIQNSESDIVVLNSNGNSYFNGGSLGIGNTNAFGLASSLVAISGSGSTYNLLNIQETVNASNAAYVQFMNSGGSAIGSITRVGTTNAVLFNTSSDIRLKKDLGVANTNIIDSVVIHDFEWLQNSLVDKGVFAQELYKIKPLAVSVGKDDVNKDGELLKPWGVDYSKLIPDLIIYCQDLKKTIKELQIEIQTLKNK